MKIATTLLLCTIFSRTCAWFFDDFQKAISSVEDSVEKLFTDVVTDVEETVDCTIMAVKQALELGENHDSTDYDVRCRGLTKTEPTPVKETIEKYSPTPPILLTPRSSKDHRIPESHKESLSEKISREICDSVENAKDTISDVIGKHSDTHTEIAIVKDRLKNETGRLSEIGGLLHSELNNLTEDVKNALSRVEADYIHPTLDNIWQDLKSLHDIELTHSNSKDASEIRKTLRNVLNVLSSNNEQGEFKERYDSENLFKLIKDRFSNMKEEHGKSDLFDTVADTLTAQSINNTKGKEKEDKRVMNNIPLTFKDVAKEIMKETKKDALAIDSRSLLQTNDNKAKTSNNLGVTVEKMAYDMNTKTNYYSDPLTPNVSHPSQAAVLETKNIIEKSKQDQLILSKLLNIPGDYIDFSVSQNDGHPSQADMSEKSKQDQQIMSKFYKTPEDNINLSVSPNDGYFSEADVLETKQIIEKSKQDQLLMSKIFKMSEDIGVSVFDSPDFNFR